MASITKKLRTNFPTTLLKVQAADYIDELEQRLHFSETTLKRLARKELTVERVSPTKLRLSPVVDEKDARIKDLETVLQGLLPYAHTGAIVRDVDVNEQPQFVSAYRVLNGVK